MRNLRQVEVGNVTRGTVLGSDIRIANTTLSRIVGLLANSGLLPGSGLLIEPSSGVHTFGMRFAIDVLALDRKLRVLGVWENLKPFRIAALSTKTHKVLELPVGAIRNSNTQVDDQLLLLEPGTIRYKPDLPLGTSSSTDPTGSLYQINWLNRGEHI